MKERPKRNSKYGYYNFKPSLLATFYNVKCSNQTKILRYVWLIWGNSKLVKWTNTFVLIKQNRQYLQWGFPLKNLQIISLLIVQNSVGYLMT